MSDRSIDRAAVIIEYRPHVGFGQISNNFEHTLRNLGGLVNYLVRASSLN